MRCEKLFHTYDVLNGRYLAVRAAPGDWGLSELALPLLRRALGRGRPDYVHALFDAVPALIDALAAPDPLLLKNAAWALGRAAPASGPAVAALAGLLKNDDDGVRLNALDALDGMGPAAVKAAPAVLERLKDDRAAVRRAAVRAVVVIGPDGTMTAALTAALKDPDVDVRYWAPEALGRAGPARGERRAASGRRGQRRDEDAGRINNSLNARTWGAWDKGPDGAAEVVAPGRPADQWPPAVAYLLLPMRPVHGFLMPCRIASAILTVSPARSSVEPSTVTLFSGNRPAEFAKRREMRWKPTAKIAAWTLRRAQAGCCNARASPDWRAVWPSWKPRLGTNSSNSSLPPSAVPRRAPSRSEKKSKRPAGRPSAILLASAVASRAGQPVEALIPMRCATLDLPPPAPPSLRAIPSPRPTIELPPVVAEVHRVPGPRPHLPCCGHLTHAGHPGGGPRPHSVGPRLTGTPCTSRLSRPEQA